MWPASAQRKDELLLSEHFAEGVRRARRRCAGSPLRVLNFDWHGMTKDLRERGAVEGLWALLQSTVVRVCVLGLILYKISSESLMNFRISEAASAPRVVRWGMLDRGAAMMAWQLA